MKPVNALDESLDESLLLLSELSDELEFADVSEASVDELDELELLLESVDPLE